MFGFELVEKAEKVGGPLVRKIQIVTIAEVPQELAQAWLQNLRDFDSKHPGCHFRALADAPDATGGEVMDMLKTDPPMPWQLFTRKP